MMLYKIYEIFINFLKSLFGIRDSCNLEKFILNSLTFVILSICFEYNKIKLFE